MLSTVLHALDVLEILSEMGESGVTEIGRRRGGHVETARVFRVDNGKISAERRCLIITPRVIWWKRGQPSEIANEFIVKHIPLKADLGDGLTRGS